MTVRFKNLYREYMGKGVPSSDFGEFKKELGNMPDEELWNTMMDMEKESVTEIGMPPMMKKQIRKELHQIIWRRRWIQFAKYAAVIALLVTSSFGIYSLFETPDTQQMITANVRPGSKSEITLPDGTKVQLNGATTITYDVNNSRQRLVHLSGEAFFDVAKNPDCPFRVIANDLQIEVLGTSFNVNTYKKDIIETSLLTGRIKISGGSLPQEYILTPGEKATYSGTDKALRITKADVHVETGWCDDYLIFDSEPLIDVIEEIERWYGVEIELRYPQIGQDLLSGSFRHESIQNVIRSLSLQYKFRYEIHKDKITIY
ncbi:FecR domain-containing protein [uncultured Bacteroides sp.]|uniref:FecR family protein n=1 Tax=uncultured Bacteroides sp. TaxID=162156 RepID=UPI0027DE88B9|nr:FecR domain-containing protein [uncultured Bacteroides sp.]